MTSKQARPCDVAWIRSAIGQCREAGVPVFCKQMGSRLRVDPTESCGDWGAYVQWGVRRDFDELKFADAKGGDPDEWPADLRVREWPG